MKKIQRRLTSLFAVLLTRRQHVTVSQAFALAMSIGVLLDSFLVRSLLVPALVSLFGRASFWPGKVPVTAETAQREAA